MSEYTELFMAESAPSDRARVCEKLGELLKEKKDMKSRITGKRVPSREYYIFFKLDTEYSKRYTTICEENIERAINLAYSTYGAMNVGSVENDENRAKQKIQYFEFKKLGVKE